MILHDGKDPSEDEDHAARQSKGVDGLVVVNDDELIARETVDGADPIADRLDMLNELGNESEWNPDEDVNRRKSHTGSEGSMRTWRLLLRVLRISIMPMRSSIWGLRIAKRLRSGGIEKRGGDEERERREEGSTSQGDLAFFGKDCNVEGQSGRDSPDEAEHNAMIVGRRGWRENETDSQRGRKPHCQEGIIRRGLSRERRGRIYSKERYEGEKRIDRNSQGTKRRKNEVKEEEEEREERPHEWRRLPALQPSSCGRQIQERFPVVLQDSSCRYRRCSPRVGV